MIKQGDHRPYMTGNTRKVFILVLEDMTEMARITVAREGEEEGEGERERERES